MNKGLKMKTSTKLIALIVILFFILLHNPLNFNILFVYAQEEGNAKKGNDGTPQTITMDFDNVDIRLVIKTMSDLLGKNFLIDDNIKGNVTIISPQAIPIEQAYKVFESILEVKGFAAVPSGQIIKIVPSRDASSRNIEMRKDIPVIEDSFEDTLITQIIPIEHATADAIKNVIGNLVSKESKLITYPPTNTIILIETVSNIERLLKIIKEIDIPTQESVVKIVPIKYADVDEVSKQISAALEDQQIAIKSTRKRRNVASAQIVKTKIIPDKRTGSLIIVAEEERFQDILDLIEKLDIPTPRGKDNIRVRPLKNSKADDMAKVLGTILNQQEVLAKKGGPEVAPLIQNSVITADKATNSLIITASPQDYEIISRIIDELDVMRPQVLVETIIAEVKFSKMKSLGVEWRTLDKPREGSIRRFGGTNFGEAAGINPENVINTLPEGFTVGVTRGTTEIFGTTFPNIAALVRANQQDGDMNILSTPHILSTDNEEATIMIGEEFPIKKTDIVDNNMINSYTYKNIGITLKLTPYINPDGYVKLEISLKVDEVLEVVEGVPRTLNREAQTIVFVKDRQTVVIGGLLRDRGSKSANRVPFLGEIPVLGWLFRHMSKSKEKTNLQVFLTPYIINTPEDLQNLTLKKSGYLSMNEKDQILDPYSSRRQINENGRRKTL